MTFCGYHPDMSVGLITFGRGVAVSTVEKARLASRSIKDHVQVELLQLTILLNEIDRAEHLTLSTPGAMLAAQSLRNMAQLCQTSFLTAGHVVTSDELVEHFEQTFAQYGQMVRCLENSFEGQGPDTDLAQRTRTAVEAAISEVQNLVKV